nr:hypothetical protein [Tanacetum cinerariifolium]
MRWHKEKRVRDDNIARHPADTEAWKHLDKINPPFARDPRNICLGLATDGFNPFGNLSSSYSIWPVFIVPYNLPPWKCMKDPDMVMLMLIPGLKTPVNIDVYLEPLIDELKYLWAGVDAYDALRKEDFTLRAVLLWTINDFPAYGMLSVGNQEPIAPKSGDEVLHDIDCSIGVSHSVVNKKKRKYLEGTRKGKTKDTWKSLQDLMDRGLKKSLHLQRRGESSVIPMACYHLTKDEKHKISNLLMSFKFPDGLASNISRGSLTKEVRLMIYELNLKLGRNWYVVESNDQRTLYNVSVEEVAEIYQEEEPHLNMPVDSNLNQPSLTRGSVPLEVVDASTAYDDSTDDEFSDDDDDIDSAKSLSSSQEESPLDDCSDSE